ncbi:ketoacyl-ACP synthase III family protein [Umezawaea tangerina]|uniref:3-oxoacyl-[acyl-carrier-protein] synthase-3 n=1 Tax=Umezawaea tangerina TaxID=84725 RepID=A0A2T0TGS5_9PSEU|nr:ketoacyl-ACP synthase III family protein [Umezawaea tangerina]PRY44825.1 3-oxoacyl-[acyl-carrier-protein] synthase-3 [Umezawaea tangerina]
MRWTGIHVMSSALAVGDIENVSLAVADGRYDDELAAAHDYASVSSAEDAHPVEMAVRAGTLALERSTVDPMSVVLHAHTGSTPQGPDDVVPAAYVQGKTLPHPVFTVDVRQMCNGALAALQLSAAYLTATGPGTAALVTTSDRHGGPGVNRYRLDPGGVDGDGASAVVLRNGPGPLRLLSTSVLGDGRFTTTTPLDPADFPDRRAFLMAHRKRLLPMLRSMSALEQECVAQALADADAKAEDVARWVFPNIGANMVDHEVHESLGVDESRTTWDWGRTVGHLGSTNQFGGLTHLTETGAVRPGDLIALCASGVGFSYGCAVLEVVDPPAWAADATTA